MRPRFKRLASAWSIFAIAFSFLFTACGRTYNIDSEHDRQAMVIDVRTALTANNCSAALPTATLLYQSKYSDNDIRMLYASAQACNVGIRLFTLLDDITKSSFVDQSSIFKSLVRLFPSRTALDSRLQSAWLAQDALQSILIPGVVIGAADQINATSVNPGSTLIRDHTNDANTYLAFISMAIIGTSLNRYGYTASQDPAAFSYLPSAINPLVWTTKALVQSDTTGAACGLASGMLNMMDGIQTIVALVSGNVTSSLNGIFSVLGSVVTTGATATCLADAAGYSSTQCSVAISRLRYRGACTEQAPAAAAAAGIISVINAGWQ